MVYSVKKIKKNTRRFYAMRFLSLSVYSTKVIFLLRKISLLIRRFNVDYVLGHQYNDKASAGGGWEEEKKKRIQPRDSGSSAEFRQKKKTK